MNKLDTIATFLEAGAGWAGAFLPKGSPAELVTKAAAALLRIAKAAIAAHEAVTGEPLDLTKLHELPKVE